MLLYAKANVIVFYPASHEYPGGGRSKGFPNATNIRCTNEEDPGCYLAFTTELGTRMSFRNVAFSLTWDDNEVGYNHNCG